MMQFIISRNEIQIKRVNPYASIVYKIISIQLYYLYLHMVLPIFIPVCFIGN